MSFHFQCLSLNVNLHVHCIGGPTQIHLLSPSVRVLILRNLDVLGLVVDLFQVDLLDDPGRLYFDSFDDVFVHRGRQLSLDLRFREPVPIPCKNQSQHYLIVASTFVLTLVCVLSSVVVGRLRGGHVGPPTAFLRRGTGVPWVSCLDPPVCPRVQDDPEAKGLLAVVVGVLGVVTSCVLCARVSRVLRDAKTTRCIPCASESTYTFFIFDIFFIFLHLVHFCSFFIMFRHLL